MKARDIELINRAKFVHPLHVYKKHILSLFLIIIVHEKVEETKRR